ncbi:MAG: FHIPEP family type III secretion protein [Phycisphaerales bacterium]|nr:FHIPEP family type III secretion protein [Phycisphaerales bacterium]
MEPRTAKMRSKALKCCSYAIAGGLLRASYATNQTDLLTSSQKAFSMNTDAWSAILVLGLLVGLINLIARASNQMLLGVEIPKQLISQTAAHGSIAFFLVVLSMTPLPTAPLLLLAVLFCALSWNSYQHSQFNEEESSVEEMGGKESVTSSARESIIKLELGCSLLSLASTDLEGNIIEKISSLRASVLDDLGLHVPSICIKDNVKLSANSYRIYLRGGIVGDGVVYPDRFMIVTSDSESLDIDGITEREPVFGLSAIWVTEEVRDSMGELFIQAMSPVSVVMTHLCKVVEKHASEMISREDVSKMVEEITHDYPRLINRVMGKTLTISRLHHILKSLLEEQVSIKDLSSIIESASDCSELSLEECVENVRSTLRRQICANVSTHDFDGKQVIRCVVLPEDLERALYEKNVSKEKILTALQHAALPLISDGLPIVVVSSSKYRRQVREQVASNIRDVVVLSKSEIVPEVDLKVVGQLEPVGLINNKMNGVGGEDKQQTIAYAKSILQKPERCSVTDRIESGIAEIRTLVREVLENEFEDKLSPLLSKSYDCLLEKGIEPNLASNIVHSLSVDYQFSEDEFNSYLFDELLKRLPRTIAPPKQDSFERNVIALVGPTGAGKTTTIAKLAARFRLQQGRSVALITADTYRVAAIDQLRQYADLFDAQLEIAGTVVQMKEAIASCSEKDIVLIDTSGRSARDGDRIHETADILEAANPTQTHLVISAASSISASKRALESFSKTRYDRMIITKLDEVVTIGEIVSTLCDIEKPISWFTDGQDVASHLDLAKSTRLIEMLLSHGR